MNLDNVKIPNPMFGLIKYLNDYHEDRIQNTNLEFLIKNLTTHFYKLIYSITNLSEIQGDKDLFKKYNSSGIVLAQPTEYCFYKISTVRDIAYQIADKLIDFSSERNTYNLENPKKEMTRYSFLSYKFEQYNETQSTQISVDWFKNINKIRNKVVHGGVNIMPFYLKDKELACFQAYDKNLEDIIPVDYYYSNRYNNNINYTDNFFGLYAHALYSYLTEFFSFVISELSCPKRPYNHSDSVLFLDYVIPYKWWYIGVEDFEQLKKITRKIILLKKSDGYSMNQLEIDDSSLKVICFEKSFRLISDAEF